MLLNNILTIATLTSFGSVVAIPAPDTLPSDVAPDQVTHSDCNMGKTTTVMETVTVDPAAGATGSVITSAATTATGLAAVDPAAPTTIIGSNNVGTNDTTAAVGTGTNETDPAVPPANGTETHKRVVGGYIASWAAYEPKWYLSDVNYKDLTHLWYSFIFLRADGKIEVGDPDIDLFGLPDEEKDKIVASLDPRPPKEVVPPQAPLDEKLQPGIPYEPIVGKNQSSDIGLKWLRDNKNATEGVKVGVALGGWTWSQNFAAVAGDEAKRKVFAESVKGFLDEWQLDGIDIDWEYPTSERVNGSLADTQNFVLLMKELRAAIGTDKEISIACSASTLPSAELNNQSLIQASIAKEMVEYVDMFNVMVYDFAGYWSEVITHDAPLYGDISGDAAIAQFKEIGVPASKLNFGIPAYGYMFRNTDDKGMGGAMSTSGDRVQGTWDTPENNMSWTGNFEYSHIQQAFAENPDWTYQFDNATAGSSLWNKEKGLVLTYDSLEAVQAKSDYVGKEGLGGMFLWELSNDRSGELIKAMAGGESDKTYGPVETDVTSTHGSETTQVSTTQAGEVVPAVTTETEPATTQV